MSNETEELEIRIATPEDMDQVMQLAFMAAEENGFIEPNTDRLVNEVWAALNQQSGLCAAIGKPGGMIEGGVLLRIGQMWYSDAPVLEERVIFIHPEYRNAAGGRASKLCDFSKKVADSLGIPLLIGVLSNHRTAAKIRLYERQFGKQSGAFFLYGAKTGELSTTEH